ncbi:hypothetical protein PQX77_007362 [Marasmius sp. AFHP31]|nr:hypothetical protein PQX77_007362 [Marasmius sp. AFHP31]
MDISEHLPSFDLSFSAYCFQLFPRARFALEALRRLGNPPSIGGVDLAQPSQQIRTAIEVMASLAGSQEAAAVRDNWTSLISPWVKFFLEDIILGDQEQPFTPEGIATWDHILMYVPRCFLAAIQFDEEEEEIKQFLKLVSPFFEPLCTQAWYRVIEDSHQTWDAWCQLVTPLTFYKNSDIRNAVPPRRVIYKFDERTGRILLHHIHFHISRIPRMSDSKISAVKMFIDVVIKYGKHNPLMFPTVIGHAMPALVKLASTIMFKRKIDPNCPSDSVLEQLHFLLVTTLQCLCTLIRDSGSAEIALNSGVLKVLLRPLPYLFQFDDTEHCSLQEWKLAHWTSSTLQLISRFIVYPNALHAFLVAIRRMDVDGLDDELCGKSRLTWECWRELKDKALLLREIRQAIRETGSISCANVNGCPLFGQSREMAPHQRVQKRRFQCSGCSWEIYCSIECQRVSWSEHRPMCRAISQSRNQIVPRLTSHSDATFFDMLAHFFVMHHSATVLDRVDRHVGWLSDVETLTQDQQLIKDRVKNPIIFLNFDTPATPTPDNCLQILDPTTLSRKPEISLQPLWLKTCIDMWDHPALDRDMTMVVATFPMHNKEIGVVRSLLRRKDHGQEYAGVGSALQAEIEDDLWQTDRDELVPEA